MDARQRETPGGLTLRDLEESTLVNGLGVPFCESLLSSFRFSSEKCGQVFHVPAKIQFIDKKKSHVTGTGDTQSHAKPTHIQVPK